MARNFHTMVNKLDVHAKLPLDTILVGSSRTRSSSSLVTDSAAGATAFSCAMKTYNGAIGVDPNQKPCGTVLESAKLSGYKTGLVVTSRITHATPASFAAHVPSREMEDQIALHEVGHYPPGRMVDLMFGGGACHFLPNSSTGSCRADETDVFQIATENGWTIGRDRSAFETSSSASLPLMVLFTPDHMSYDIDRDSSKEPSLKEMSARALEILLDATKDSDRGFFLMIEGSRIDMAAHSNDPAAHVRDILAYQDTIEYVKGFVNANPGTVMISVSDHETGGLSLAKQLTAQYPEYLWKPEALVPVKKSTIMAASGMLSYAGDSRETFLAETVLKDWLGILDPSPEELAFLTGNHTVYELDLYLGLMLSNRAQVGWSTHGHSAVDVNLYAHGENFHELVGNHENTDIGDFIVRFLGLNLQKVTKMLSPETLWSSADALATALIAKPPLMHDMF
ncbi:vacuolar alkaline phosphatase [Quaeritorhiza haematococci]|nr:vacuolar alkaline phosphatase [Quaeritorhiza haematococci]